MVNSTLSLIEMGSKRPYRPTSLSCIAYWNRPVKKGRPTDRLKMKLEGVSKQLPNKQIDLRCPDLNVTYSGGLLDIWRHIRQLPLVLTSFHHLIDRLLSYLECFNTCWDPAVDSS